MVPNKTQKSDLPLSQLAPVSPNATLDSSYTELFHYTLISGIPIENTDWYDCAIFKYQLNRVHDKLDQNISFVPTVCLAVSTKLSKWVDPTNEKW